MAATTVLPRPKNYDDTFFKPISLWLTTTDHKLIGIMYMVTGVLSFVIGGIFALIIRLQLSQPNAKVVDAETYSQLISAPETWPFRASTCSGSGSYRSRSSCTTAASSPAAHSMPAGQATHR